MWLKIVLLVLCLLSLFLISRLLEASLFYDAGLFSTTILDPMALSVRQLKRILETRGVSFVGMVEKQELTSLVEASGHIMEGELMESSSEDASAFSPAIPPSTQFTCGSHFYEEVEDTKDSVWLVQIVPSESRSPLLDDYNWRQVIARVKPFGIRTGVLNCYLDKRLCNRKEWHTPQIILALPRGSRAKDTVVFRSFASVPRAEPVLHWVKEQLTSRLKVIGSLDELEASWLTFADSSPNIHVVALSGAKEPPLFFSALSMKFAGRAAFGIAYDLDLSGRNRTATAMPAAWPAYVVVTPEGVFPYGTRAGQHFTFRSMEFFLRTLQPELNDVFVASLTLANLLACLDFFLLEGKLWKHVVKCCWTLAKYNSALLLAWLALLGLGHFCLVQAAAEMGLKLARTATLADATSLLWRDLRFLRANPPLLLAALLALGAANAWLRKRFFPAGAGAPGAFALSLDSYVMSCFFRPMATLTRPVAIDVDFAEEMERLVERLAMPNLWLQPVSPQRDYIEALPVWRHQTGAACDSSDEAERSLTDSCVDCTTGSDTDSSAGQDRPRAEAQPRCTGIAQTLKDWCSFCRKLRTMTICKPFFRGAKRGQRSKRPGDPPPGTIVNPECAICLESYRHRDLLCGLPCGHNYHQHCILGWLLRDKHHCPTCRWPSYKPRPGSHSQVPASDEESRF